MPPLPQACLGFSCLRQGPGGFSGGGNGGEEGHFSVDAGCPCGEHKAVPRVQELVSALAAWQDPCLEHP